jgi:uncharacterized protein (UPF0332 family)
VKDTTRKLIQKAARAIKAAERLAAESDSDFAVARAYYAMFYVAEALLNDKGLSFRKHSGVHAAYGQEFATTVVLDPKFHRYLLDAFDKRILGDYGIDATMTIEDAKQLIQQAREFLEEAERYLGA